MAILSDASGDSSFLATETTRTNPFEVGNGNTAIKAVFSVPKDAEEPFKLEFLSKSKT